MPSTRSASTSKPRFGQGAHDVERRQAALHQRVGRVGHEVRVERRHVERAVGLHDGLGVLVAEARQVELVEHRAQRVHGAPPQRQQLGVRLRAQHALEAPVALHDEVVVDVLGVEVRGPERVVVGRDRAEAREQEVGAREQQRQRVRRAPDVGGRHQRVVAGARLEVVHHREQVLGDHLAHAVGHRTRDVDAVDAAVLGALRARPRASPRGSAPRGRASSSPRWRPSAPPSRSPT